MTTALAAAPQTCRDHPDVAASGACSACGRQLCDVCSFEVGYSRLCPDCATAGPSAEERSKVLSGGLLSIGLVVLSFLALGGVMAAGVAGVELSGVADRVVTTAMLLTGVGGLAAGISSREGARRTGSVLPVIGIVGSAVLLVVLLAFTVMAVG